jgi:Tfp pilus assembly protein PilF
VLRFGTAVDHQPRSAFAIGTLFKFTHINLFFFSSIGWKKGGKGFAFRQGMRHNGRVDLRSVVPLLLMLTWTLSGANTDLQRAEEHYQHTEYTAAIQTLLLYAPKTAAVKALIGKSYYMDGQYKSFTKYLERAVAADGSNSGYNDWLGKAYGRRAEESSFIAALPLAIKARESFEKAVALNPVNLEALGDLFEFYLQAPSVIGGGVEKAEAIAVPIGQLSEPESHYVRARLAEKRKDSREAEMQYRKAMEAAPHDVGRVIDLAAFLSRQGRYQESDDLFEAASEAEPQSSKVVFERAAAYVRSRRNLPQAQKLLEKYAELPHTPDDPSRSEVARLAQNLR